MTASQIVPRRWLKQADLSIIALMLILTGMGLLALASIGMNGSPVYLRRQLLWVALGLTACFGAALVDLERLVRAARGLYWVNVGILAAVLIVGHETKGSVRWFGTESVRFQPSELAKLLLTVTLAALYAQRMDRIATPALVVRSVAHILLPAVLILKQPDLGTSLSLIAIWMGIAFVAGTPLRYLVAVALCGCGLLAVAWQTGIIHDYQKERVLVIVRPGMEPSGAGYQVRQARIAIGSGRVTGRGLGHGSQAHKRFIPERQTDFIFTIVAEEGGFAASVVIVATYTLLVFRGWTIVASTPNVVDRLTGAGLVSMFAFHFVVNIGMTLGLLPVTGVPLPLMSYGGSSMIVSMASVGLLVGISSRREPLVF